MYVSLNCSQELCVPCLPSLQQVPTDEGDDAVPDRFQIIGTERLSHEYEMEGVHRCGV